jgi:polyhydroxyalkanoate synthesis regulator phasin
MDVERVQKINNLALELMRQGLATDREKAVSQAEKILAKKDCSSLNEAMEAVNEAALKEAKDGSEEEKEELSPSQIRDILEKNTSFIVKKMKEYQSQLEELKKEIAQLSNEVSFLKREQARQKPLPAQPSPMPSDDSGAESATNSKNKASGNVDHPRSGNYSENEVSIDKFFYCGNKPQNN